MSSASEVSFASRELQDLALPHRVEVDPRTGTAAISVDVPLTPGRGGFQPALVLTYSSAAPNSVYGLGWALSGIPSVAVNRREGVPRYDATDTYAFAGTELVPWLEADSAGARIRDAGAFWVHLYRSRTERTFTRFEKWVHKSTRRVHWRLRDRNDNVSIFGLDAAGQTRIADPEDEQRTFEWLLEWQYDPHGNAIRYSYAPEDGDEVPSRATFEYDRLRRADGFPQRYLERIHYGNTRPLHPGDTDPGEEAWLYTVLFDYGARDGTPTPPYETAASWSARPDPFSVHRAGFEVRTYRLCRRILMFHRFRELGTGPTLTGALQLRHREYPAGSTLESIRYTGYRRDAGTGMYTHKSLPPLMFRYTEPAVGQVFVAAPEGTGENAPYGIGGLNYRWIDLYGEGLPGVLFETDQAWYYKPNLGGGRLGAQRKVVDRPSVQPGQYSFSDFDGDGNLNLVVLQGREAGYYEYDRDHDRWTGFRPFSAAPHVKALDATTQLLDLDGDGRADIVTVEQDRITWYRSRGKEGFDAAVELAKPSSNGVSRTPTIGPNPTLDYFFADMTGDGRPDQVRVRNGCVEYWPQLGNGRFGAGVLVEGAPRLDFETEFDASRIRLIDLDGSGTADLLYIGRGEIRYWINASGNRFVEGGTIRGLPYIDRLASAQVLDFLGDGTPCLVWSTALPGHAQTPIQFLPLTNGVKPRLLVAVENGMGRETQVSYGYSATHYLRDRQAGRGWITKLPQHVTVVDRLTVIDHIGNARFESLYEYHDGSFDGEERAFRGFGLVDQYDSDRYRGTSTGPEVEHAEPVCVRNWFHNGMAGWEPRRAQDYYRGDSRAASLRGPFIEDLERFKPGEFAEAFRALAGEVVRTEVYGLGADGRRAAHPFQVIQTNHRLRRLQPKRKEQDACFAVLPGESLTYVYEQNPADPRVAHTFTLEADDFGNVRRGCSIAYPRRAAQRIGIAAQADLHLSGSQADVLNVDEDDRYQLGISIESRSFQVAGLALRTEGGADAVFRLDELTRALDAALRPDQLLRFDEPFTGGVQARLMEWHRLHYWNDARSDFGPWGEVGAVSLLHHTESACCTDELFTDVFGDRMLPETARAEGLYRFHDGYWWQAGPILHYEPAEHFNLIARQTQTVHRDGGAIDAITYTYDDSYWLNLTSVTDALGNRAEATHIDYHLPAPDRITDPNGNVAEVRYDPLGVVVVATQYGRILSSAGVEEDYGNDPLSEYRPQSDDSLDRVLAEPERFLQRAGTYFHYDLETWTAPDPRPLRSLTLVREAFVHDGEGGGRPDSRIQVQVAYLDGFGRTLQAKERVEPGPAVDVDPSGHVVSVGRADPRWRASGHTVFDNKQQVLHQYEPFFSTTYEFESDEVLETFGVTTVTEYDPLGRVVRVLYPNGTRSRTGYAGWETVQYDGNDTVHGSLYEALREAQPDSNPEKQALRKALDHADTPTHAHLDPLGREVVLVEEGGTGVFRRTETTLDFSGNPTAIVDPRLLTAFTYRRDMLGLVLYEHSIDAGEKWNFTDALRRPVHVWDGRDVHQRLDHDALGRVVSVHVDGALDLDQYTERIVYGEDASVSQAVLRNLRGQPVRHYDQAGVLRFHRYDPAGQPLYYDRQLASEYKHEPDWSDAAIAAPGAVLDDDVFETQLRYDARGRMTWQHLPDGSTRQIDYHRGGGVHQVRVSTADGVLRDVPFLDETTYNARGQRTGALLGNGVAIRYEYDRETFRLGRLYARQPAPDDPDLLDPDPAPPERPPRRVYQDIRYTYDPVGNLVHLVDRAHESPRGDVLSLLRGDVHSTSTFTYDAFYQLREATGRFHEALQQHDYDARRDGEPQWIKGTRHLSLDNADVVRRYTRTYGYDLSGNLRRIEHHLHMPGGDTSRRWHTDLWVSSASNRALPALDLLGLPGPDPDAPTSFDANGNCLYLPHLQGFEWNYRNNLARAVVVSRADHPDRDDDAEYYVYGGDGQRVRKVHERVVNGDGLEITEKIYLDGCEIKRIRNGERPILERTTSHVTDGSERLALVHQWTVDEHGRETDDLDRKGIHYQLSNHLGSSSLELDQDGSVISYEEYFPYGGTAFVAGRSGGSARRLRRETSRKDYRYSGKERDDVTGLYYYGFRYYVPWLGRWLSPDPIGPEDGPNLYRFVQNCPVNLRDRNGLQSWSRFSPFPNRDVERGHAEPRVILSSGQHHPITSLEINPADLPTIRQPGEHSFEGQGGEYYLVFTRVTEEGREFFFSVLWTEDSGLGITATVQRARTETSRREADDEFQTPDDEPRTEGTDSAPSQRPTPAAQTAPNEDPTQDESEEKPKPEKGKEPDEEGWIGARGRAALWVAGGAAMVAVGVAITVATAGVGSAAALPMAMAGVGLIAGGLGTFTVGGIVLGEHTSGHIDDATASQQLDRAGDAIAYSDPNRALIHGGVLIIGSGVGADAEQSVQAAEVTSDLYDIADLGVGGYQGARALGRRFRMGARTRDALEAYRARRLRASGRAGNRTAGTGEAEVTQAFGNDLEAGVTAPLPLPEVRTDASPPVVLWRPWRRGDPHDALTGPIEGYEPAWRTIRERFWKNLAEDPDRAFALLDELGVPPERQFEEFFRMADGHAPRDPLTGLSIELEHVVPQRTNIPHRHRALLIVTQLEHSFFDRFRYATDLGGKRWRWTSWSDTR